MLLRGTRVAGAIFIEYHSCHPGVRFRSLGQGIGGRANPLVMIVRHLDIEPTTKPVHFRELVYGYVLPHWSVGSPFILY